MISLIIPGEPVAKGRPRVCNGHTFTPAKTVNYETLVKELFIISNQKKIMGELKAKINCYFSIPKSASKSKKSEMYNGIIRPVKKPDLDNIAKICLDALNTLAYDDDSQVVELCISKWYANMPRVEICISVESIL